MKTAVELMCLFVLLTSQLLHSFSTVTIKKSSNLIQSSWKELEQRLTVSNIRLHPKK